MEDHMFKRSEESEWSRFSKAFTGKDEKGEGGEPTDEEATTIAPEAAAASPTVASPSARPAMSDSNFTVARPTITPAAAPAVHPVYSSDDVESVIGEHSSFDGTYRSESSIRIRGTAEGEIECAKAVFIEENAKVSAKVTATSIMVAGEVNGELNCSGRVEIRPTGRVTGTINAGVLIMQEGAFFDGNLKMRPTTAEAEPASASS
jgi:cytoskeletal protein CcmA (bactofilin family)